MTILTLEDIVAAGRCIALWTAVGADPARVARRLCRAAARAARFREAAGRPHPWLGDGSLAAAAGCLTPGRLGAGTEPIGTRALLAAFAPLALAVAQAGCDKGEDVPVSRAKRRQSATATSASATASPSQTPTPPIPSPKPKA